MKKNQKGFSVVELILLLIILGMILATGWFVIKSHNNTTQILDKAAKTNFSTSTKKQSANSTPNFSSLPFKYSYPSSWTTKDNGDNKSYFILNLNAPGTDIQENPGGGNVVSSGAQISISKTLSQSYKTLQEFKNASTVTSTYATNKKDLVLDGRDAMQFDLAYEGPPTHCVIFFEKSIYYSLCMQQQVYNKPSYAEIFNSLIDSIKFD